MLAGAGERSERGAVPAALGDAEGGSLDFYTNKSAKAPKKLDCRKPRIGLRLRSSNGKWARVRCGMNDCLGCYQLKCLERAQMVYEDALLEQPKYAITLSTRAPKWNAPLYREAKHQTLRRLRAEFGRVEMLEFMEQTTGTAPASGGHKRGHGHNLVKMDDGGHVLELEKLIVPIWKRITGAWQIRVHELASAGGAAAYLTLNLAFEKGKAVQAPTELPKGTRTLRPTRNYWSVPAPELRARAKDHHARRRLRHALTRLLEDEDGTFDADFLDLVFEDAWKAQTETTWELWQVRDHPDALALFEPIKPLERPTQAAESARLVRTRGQLVNARTGEVWNAGQPTAAKQGPRREAGGAAAITTMERQTPHETRD
jgi:hypothetical protein